MHELAVTKSILKLVLNAAREIKAKKVQAIYLTVGEMRNLEQDWIQRYFDYISANTLAEGARIEVKKVPVVFHCKQCGQEFSADIHQEAMIHCSHCSSLDYSLLTGLELVVENMEVI
ncbi:hydrogenase maturation nickel metallochaperone HypA [Dehalobacter sp. DCM]|uniref:hydrogenase maturation nickel metallochaperone HypA n=1 Tax=Dehalobacter sp. DCM TaxID=2907827 RepID=UPI003081C2C8|nr:hydrogenase maturation nickel metallochaperone HypA [Dehalobacter sp. DCM]